MMNRDQLLKAFELLGTRLREELTEEQRVAIWLTGSAAALLHGDLSRDVKDCDMVRLVPHTAEDAVDYGKSLVANDLGLEQEWLNHQAMFFSVYLPPNWQERVEPVCDFGPLTVFSLSRGDMLASKALGVWKTGDDKHRIDFDAMNPNSGEIASAIAVLRESADRNDQDLGKCISFLEERLVQSTHR
jgi:hypothetical protein